MGNWADFPYLQQNAYQGNYLGPGTDTPHWALDIQTPFHTSLTAPLAGTVEKADYTAWGGEIFILPDDQSILGKGVEYYFYHPDELEAFTGQHVQAGQEIAISGGENPGYPGALHPAQPQWSSGPHTHFGEFTGWRNTPAGTRPYGPAPFHLLDIAKGAPALPAAPGLSSISPLDSSIQSGLPGIPDIGQAISNFEQWIGNTAGGFFLRLGVGAIGLGLIWLGGHEIVAAMGEAPASSPAPAAPAAQSSASKDQAEKKSAAPASSAKKSEGQAEKKAGPAEKKASAARRAEAALGI